MKIAVLSGKGGTGKTTVSASLWYVVKPSQYIDFDVEEPNGNIFIKPFLKKPVLVNVLTPDVDRNLCTGCGECAAACQFNAIAVIKGNVLFFPELCHHCGACYLACRHNALFAAQRNIGILEEDADKTFIQGKLNVGEPVAVPVIRELKKYQRNDVPVICDCSPGASCTVVESIEDSDYCLLVTEPTPFGLSDLKIAVKLVKKLGKPLGIVINKSQDDNSVIEDYCNKENISVLLKLPYSDEVARAYSKGLLLAEYNTEWKEKFELLYKNIKEALKA